MDGNQIIEVTTSKHWRDFFSLRNTIYRNDPYAVRPLRSMERLLVDDRRHPFYEHARRALFVAYRDGRPVGRIAAIIDDLYNEHHRSQLGFFGFFEAIDDEPLAQQLLITAERWLEQRGCDRMRGPVNPSMKGEFGVVVEGHQTLPMLMTAHTPPYYEKLLLSAGMEVAKQFFCFRQFSDRDLPLDNWAETDRMVKLCRKRFPKLSFRQVRKADYEQTLRDINYLANRERAGNYGFVPLTDAELEFMIKQLKRVIRLDMIIAAYWEDELVGYVVNLPDINWALKKSIGPWDWIRIPQFLYWLRKTPRTRVIALGVHENYRTKGIAISLIDKLIKRYLDYHEWDLSWVVEDNLNSIRVISRTMQLKRYKTFRLYEKAIGTMT